jgi:hypothetical protein
MKKHLYRFLISAALCTISFQNAQAQCIATTRSEFQTQDAQAPATSGSIEYGDYSASLGNYAVYVLPGSVSNRYKFSSNFCFTNGNYCYGVSGSYLTITDMKDSVLATGVPPLTITTKATISVKVHHYTSQTCGTGISGSAYQRYSLETVTCVPSYKDADGDGLGDPNVKGTLACPTPDAGFVLNGNDCNDNTIAIKAALKWYPDLDGDGFGDLTAKPVISCTKPLLRTESADIVTDSTDCDDNNANVFPGNADVDGDNFDASCDGSDGVNNALNFDGVDDNVSAPSLDLSALSTFTIEAWIKPTAFQALNEISRQNTNSDPTWVFSFQYFGTYLAFGLATTNAGYTELLLPVKSSDFTDGKWHHVAAVYDATKKYVYVDGNLIGSQSESGKILKRTTATHSIGSSNGTSEFFAGSMDEVRYWAKALSAAEVKASVATEKPKNTTDLLLQYTFNQGVANGTNTSITTATDASGNGKTATLSNFALTSTTSNFVSGGAFVFTPIVTGVEQQGNNASYSVYPNPSNGTFSVSSTSELGNVSVYNSLGTMVYQNATSAKQLNIELPSKEAGIYFVKVGNKMTKLIKE